MLSSLADSCAINSSLAAAGFECVLVAMFFLCVFRIVVVCFFCWNCLSRMRLRLLLLLFLLTLDLDAAKHGQDIPLWPNFCGHFGWRVWRGHEA
jgi:hypothetical protein